MKRIVSIAIKDIKVMLRTKEMLFWNIAFPIIMMLLFTAIFGGETQFTVNIGVVDYDHSNLSNTFIDALNATDVMKIKLYEDNQTLFDEIINHRLNAYVVIPEGFEENITSGYSSYVKVYVDNSNPQIASVVEGLLNGYVQRFNEEIRNIYIEKMGEGPVPLDPSLLEHIKAFGKPLDIVSIPVKGTERVGYKEYMLVGAIGYGFLFSSMASATMVIVNEKTMKTIRRIKLSPTSPIEMLLGKTITILLNTYLYVMIVLAVSFILVRPNVIIQWPEFVLIVTLGALSGIAIGLIISILFKTPEGASGAAVTIAVLLQFLIGLYFPLEMLPPFLRQISWYIPMTYATSILRSITVFGESLWRFTDSIIILFAADVILYTIGALAYKLILEKEE